MRRLAAPFALWGITLAGTWPKAVAELSVAFGSGRISFVGGFERRCSGGSRGRRPPPPCLGAEEGTGGWARRNSGGRSERALHHGIMREASPSNIIPAVHRRYAEGYATHACFFQPKACQYAPSIGMTRFASPRIRRPAPPARFRPAPAPGDPTARMAGIGSILARADTRDRLGYGLTQSWRVRKGDPPRGFRSASRPHDKRRT
jgi:hypothetical protein